MEVVSLRREPCSIVSVDFEAVWSPADVDTVRPLGCRVGVFPTDVEAAVAYDRAVRIHIGPTAPLNFPNKSAAEVASLIAQARVGSSSCCHCVCCCCCRTLLRELCLRGVLVGMY